MQVVGTVLLKALLGLYDGLFRGIGGVSGDFQRRKTVRPGPKDVIHSDSELGEIIMISE